jgi:5-methyltetrahydrofolate--homocysteine methyltransferase
MVELKELQEALFLGDISKVKEIIQKALQENIDPKEILEQGLIKGMEIVGIKFKNNDIFLPEVLLASQAMYGGMELLQPILIKSGVKAVGKVIIGTTKGDLHDIGKNLVAMMLKGGGLEPRKSSN